MRKRAILLALALMSVLNCFASYVYDTVYVSTISYKILSESDKTVAVTSPPSYNRINDTIRIFKYGGDIVIPSTVVIDSIEYRVTEIANGVFSYCAKLTSVTIPNGVTKIGEQAFSRCNITSMTIPGSIISIGNSAFLGCRELKSITIEEGVTIIGDDTFNDCTELTSVTIPESVTKIGDYAFLGCSNLNTITIPKSVSSIGTMAFNECDLDSIIVDPENSIYDSRGGCNALIETASNTLLTGCRNTVIPESVTTISRAAFFRCFSLTSITIPESVTAIGDYAFTYCVGLSAISIPEKVDSIGMGILALCINLSSITIDDNNQHFNSFGKCNAIIDSSGNLLAGCINTVIPSGVKSIGLHSFEGCRMASIVIPEGVESIGSFAFTNCINLTSVEMPSSLTYIGGDAFRYCSSLSSIIIPRNISFIGDGAFRDCIGLTSVTILSETYAFEESYYYPEPFKGINYDSCSLYVPDGCYLAYRKNSYFSPFYRSLNNVHILKNPDCITIDGINYCIVSRTDKTVRVVHGDYSGDLVIPSSITINGTDYSVLRISNEAFINCNQLTSIVVNEGVTSIGEYAFSQCESLKSAILPTSVEKIGDCAFSGCQSMLSFNIPQGVKTIGVGMFEGCITLNSIEIPPSVDSISSGAFSGCCSLKAIYIPEGVRVINENTFGDCLSLNSISIPSSVDSIGRSAFYGCKSLESIIVPEGVRTISDGTFSGCESLSYLSLPASVKAFGKNVFDDCYALKSAGPKGSGYNYEFSWTDTIPGSAFNGMKSLRSVYIPKCVRLINDQGLVYADITIIDDYGTTRSFFKACYFEGCDSLESLAISFSDTKIMRGYNQYYIYRYQDYADYYLFIGTPIHSISFLDDTIKTYYNYDLAKIDELAFSEYVKDVNPRLFNLARYIKKFDVENGNANYSSRNGVLFNKSANELLAYPSAREEAFYSIPNSVVKIEDYAFYKAGTLRSVTIPEDVEIIGEGAFEGCRSLESVIIAGSPIVDHNAFLNCPNIETVRSWSAIPGEMQLYDTPQPIMVGVDYGNKGGIAIEEWYNQELRRYTYRIRYAPDWDFDIISTDIPAGQYKVSIGILPNEIDLKPNYFHPIIKGITESTDVVLHEQIDTIFVDNHRPRLLRKKCLTNDISGYDSVLITDTLIVPEGLDGIKITLADGINGSNAEKYTSQLWLDRIFFEPLDKDLPEERYAGPFAESVFNNATLLVLKGAVSTYKSADGWKLFKNIQVETSVKPVYQDGEEQTMADAIIYDLLGRRVNADRVEMLQPGLYIINGKKYLVK